MKATSVHVEKLVEQQVARWYAAQEGRKKSKKAQSGPVITISREIGCGTTEIAQKLSERLHMDLMHGKIINLISESSAMSEQVVASLDEKDVTERENWLHALFSKYHLWPDQYLHHLSKVIGTIGRHGNAVVLGRGANFLLPQKDTFSIRIIAPLELKIQNCMAHCGESHDEVRRFVLQKEADRKAFIRKYFHADVGDPVHYDLVLNMEDFSIDGAVDLLACAFNAWNTQREKH